MNILQRIFESKTAKAKRLAEEAETRRLAEEVEARRVAQEAERKRLAEEAERKRLAEEADKKRQAEKAVAERQAREAETKKKGDQLFAAVKAGDIDKVKVALKDAADVNAKDEHKNTCLIYAVQDEHAELVTILINAGADIEARGVNEWSPLMRAVSNAPIEIIEQLLAAGANPRAITSYGSTVLTYAKERGDVVEMLTSNSATFGRGIQRLSEFKEVRTSSGEEATRVLFNEALLATPLQDRTSIQLAYNGVARKWGSRRLVEGAKQAVHEVVLRNLRRIASEPEFKDFSVLVNVNEGYAQVNAVFSNAFIGVRLWHTKDETFASGNSLFTG